MHLSNIVVLNHNMVDKKPAANFAAAWQSNYSSKIPRVYGWFNLSSKMYKIQLNRPQTIKSVGKRPHKETWILNLDMKHWALDWQICLNKENNYKTKISKVYKGQDGIQMVTLQLWLA